MPKARIEGTVADGYEPVREVFARQFADSRHANAQVCAYVGGAKVVDLWGSAVGDEEYDGDSIQTVFSATKSVTSIAFACLVGTGAVDYSDKISKHWPQFGKNGKEDLKVEDLMRHEGGLARWAGTISYEDTLRENVKQNSIGKVIEEEELSFPDGEPGKREYHGLTRGWILNEIFQRVHPDGKTIGEFLSEEIAGPLGIDVYIGAPDGGNKNCKLTAPTNGYLLLNSALPGFISRRVEVSALQMIKAGLAISKNAKKAGQASEEKARTAFPITGVAPKDLAPSNMCNVLDTETMRPGESPSANGACSARGLAHLGAGAVGGGVGDGGRVMVESAVESVPEAGVPRESGSGPGWGACA